MWKEPADKQFQAIVKTMETGSLNMANMCCVSRDNPNVNKKLISLLDQYMRDKNLIELLDVGLCALHPTHTSFWKALDELDTDVWSFAIDLHAFLRSPPHEGRICWIFPPFSKMKLICSFFDQLTLIAYRPSQYSRGLSVSGKLSPSTFVKNSSHQNEVRARTTKRYIRIVDFFKPF